MVISSKEAVSGLIGSVVESYNSGLSMLRCGMLIRLIFLVMGSCVRRLLLRRLMDHEEKRYNKGFGAVR